MIILDIQQQSEAWHEARNGRFTGTDFKTVMSGKATKGYQDLITNIAGQRISGESETGYSNDLMERGKELESVARQEYEQTLDAFIEEVGFICHDDYEDWVGVSPDGAIWSEEGLLGGLEIKCPLAKTHLGYMFAGVLPNEYKWQVQGALWVTKLPYWDFMSYYPNMKPFIVRVEPDKIMHEQLEERITEAIREVEIIIERYEQYDVFGDELTNQLKKSIDHESK